MYKQGQDFAITVVTSQAISVTKELDLSDGVESVVRKRVFITAKDHENKFGSHMEYRLTNPQNGNLTESIKSYMKGSILK